MEKLLILVLPVIFGGFSGCSVYAQELTTETEASVNTREKFEFFTPSLPESVKTLDDSNPNTLILKTALIAIRTNYQKYQFSSLIQV